MECLWCGVCEWGGVFDVERTGVVLCCGVEWRCSLLSGSVGEWDCCVEWSGVLLYEWSGVGYCCEWSGVELWCVSGLE